MALRIARKFSYVSRQIFVEYYPIMSTRCCNRFSHYSITNKTKTMIVSFTYLSHSIEIDLPDPEDSNVVFITLSKASGTFDPNIESAYLADFQYNTQTKDPNQWIAEAVTIAISGLAQRGIHFYCLPTTVADLVASNDISDVPF